MKSERMKTSGMGRGAGGKESEIVLGFMGGGVFLESAMEKFCIIWLLLSSSRGKKTKTGRNEQRRGCDFANI